MEPGSAYKIIEANVTRNKAAEIIVAHKCLRDRREHLEMNVALNEHKHNISRGKVLLERHTDQEKWETSRGLLCNSAIVSHTSYCAKL